VTSSGGSARDEHGIATPLSEQNQADVETVSRETCKNASRPRCSPTVCASQRPEAQGREALLHAAGDLPACLTRRCTGDGLTPGPAVPSLGPCSAKRDRSATLPRHVPTHIQRFVLQVPLPLRRRQLQSLKIVIFCARLAACGSVYPGHVSPCDQRARRPQSLNFMQRLK
jgi:hypothetical protein